MFERIDFQTPRRPDESSSRFLSRWQKDTCNVVLEYWKTLLQEQIQLSAVAVTPMVASKLMESMPSDTMGAHIEIGNQRIPSMLTSPGRLNLTLVESVLNIQGEDWPAQRKMSAGELAILEILFESFNRAIQDSWSGIAPISSRYISLVSKPSRSRIFAASADLFVFKFHIETAYGEEHLLWLTPKQQMEDLISSDCHIHSEHFHEAGQKLSELTERIPAEIKVLLGSAEIQMSQALDLESGDVLMLDQPIRKPLTAYVGDRPKWKVNPVTIGSRVGFEVDSLIEE